MATRGTVIREGDRVHAGWAEDRRVAPALVPFRVVRDGNVADANQPFRWHGHTFAFLGRDGQVRRCRVSSKIRRWKRTPGRVEFAVKYGLYESATVRRDGEGVFQLPGVGPLLVECERGTILTGARCVCKKGEERDNCPACEGGGWALDFAAMRARYQASQGDGASDVGEGQAQR